MEEFKKFWSDLPWYAKCFWISLVVVIGVFMVPIESETSTNEGVTTTKRKTLWGVISGQKPSYSWKVQLKD